jgi:thiamine-monophosphate kinase
MTKLGDIGERRLIDDFFAPRYSRHGFSFGDDCSIVLVTSEGTIVESVDPAPRPVAWELDLKDYFHWGWLLGAINLSDLAAAGARPLSLLTSFILPNEMDLADLTRFLDGLDTCCETYSCPVVGGNVTDGPEFRCEATVTGQVSGGLPFSRRGATVGDKVVAIGRSGNFWSGLLTLTRDYPVHSMSRAELVDAIVRPVPQVEVAAELYKLGTVHACTDASDGLYYAIHSLTVSQGLGFRVEPSMIAYPDIVLEVAALAGIEPFRLLLGFGDMQIVVAVSDENLELIEATVVGRGQRILTLGMVTDTGRLEMTDNGIARELGNFDNERLTEDSQFTAGLAAYQKRLLEQPLFRAHESALARSLCGLGVRAERHDTANTARSDAI